MSQIIYDLRFSHDWNTRKKQGGKLQNLCFTAIRMDSDKYEVGNIYRVFNENNGKKSEVLGYARMIKKTTHNLENLNEWLSFLDTGYNKTDTQVMIKKMYGTRLKPDTILCTCLLKYLNDAEITELAENIRSGTQTQIDKAIT